ncbi:MAG: hypothetical protein Q8R26_03435 [bacterium]|nr:hypothetical protein [bacterium]
MLWKKLVLIFILAFVANSVWEYLHAPLYIHYRGDAITSLILFRAALFDAVFTTLLGAFFLTVPYFRQRLWLSIVIGIIFAVCLEIFALNTGRWAYTDYMPIIPLLDIGITPTAQLGIISYIIFKSVIR